MLNKIRNTRFFHFIKNVCCLFRCDIYKELSELKNKQNQHEKSHEINHIIKRIKEYYFYNPEIANKYLLEIQNLKNNEGFIFPYKQIKKIELIECGLDTTLSLPYVIHKGKRLYFPHDMTADNAANSYRYFIETENILGGGYSEKSPHQYESDDFKVEDCDILLDIGCAEALFALDHIEKAKKVYLIESNDYWADALKATFAPYSNKVVFINKLISNIDSDDSITLTTMLKNETSDHLFIKMDIEGFEQIVLKSSMEYLTDKANIKIACCTYHRQNDFEDISTLLNSKGFKTESSDGYMIFPWGEIKPPYFRKGIIRAKKCE